MIFKNCIIAICIFGMKLLVAANVDHIGDSFNQFAHRVRSASPNSLVQAVFEASITYYSQTGLSVAEAESKLKLLYLNSVCLHHFGGWDDLKRVSKSLPIGDYVREIDAITFTAHWPFPIIRNDITSKVLALQELARAVIADETQQLQRCSAIFAAAMCGARAVDIEEVANNLLRNNK
jgi:hypothetical protein